MHLFHRSETVLPRRASVPGPVITGDNRQLLGWGRYNTVFRKSEATRKHEM